MGTDTRSASNLTIDTVAGPVQLQNLDFFAIDSASIHYMPMKVEGDLGLAPRKVPDYQTLLENIASSKVFPAKFSIYLPRMPDEVVHRGEPAYWNVSIGEIWFGGSDGLLYSPPMQFAPISGDDQWQVSASSVDLGQLKICENCPVTVNLYQDSIGLPEDAYMNVLETIGAIVLPGSGNVFIDCQTMPSLPNLDLAFGDFVLSLLPTEYIYVDRNPEYTACYPAFTIDEPVTLGKVFFRKFVVEFDYENRRIGFAPIKY